MKTANERTRINRIRRFNSLRMELGWLKEWKRSASKIKKIKIDKRIQEVKRQMEIVQYKQARYGY